MKELSEMTQKEMILDYLQTHVGITDSQAREIFGINRLSGRIYDLRRDGYTIIDVRRSCPNRFGKKTSFVEYRLAEG